MLSRRLGQEITLQRGGPQAYASWVTVLLRRESAQEQQRCYGQETTGVGGPKASGPLQKVLEMSKFYWRAGVKVVTNYKEAKALTAVEGMRNLSWKEKRFVADAQSDMLTLIPFSLFGLIPFSFYLLPLIVKFFPGILPRPFVTAHQWTGLRAARALQVGDTRAQRLAQALGSPEENEVWADIASDKRERHFLSAAACRRLLEGSKSFTPHITAMPRAFVNDLCGLYKISSALGTKKHKCHVLMKHIGRIRMDDLQLTKELPTLSETNLIHACLERRLFWKTGEAEVTPTPGQLHYLLQQWMQLSEGEAMIQMLYPALNLANPHLVIPEADASTYDVAACPPCMAEGLLDG